MVVISFTMAGLGSMLCIDLDGNIVLSSLFYLGHQVSGHAKWLGTWQNARPGCRKLGYMLGIFPLTSI